MSQQRQPSGTGRKEGPELLTAIPAFTLLFQPASSRLLYQRMLILVLVAPSLGSWVICDTASNIKPCGKSVYCVCDRRASPRLIRSWRDIVSACGMTTTFLEQENLERPKGEVTLLHPGAWEKSARMLFSSSPPPTQHTLSVKHTGNAGSQAFHPAWATLPDPEPSLPFMHSWGKGIFSGEGEEEVASGSS